MEVGRRQAKEVLGLCMGRDCGRMGMKLVIGWLPVRLCWRFLLARLREARRTLCRRVAAVVW